MIAYFRQRPRLLILATLFLIAYLFYLFWELPGHNSTSNSSTAISTSEHCLDCHAGMVGFAPAHDPATIGCTSCHLGDPASSSLNEGHRGMVLIPGNLSDVDRTCGTAGCHQDLAQRVEKSLMTTMAGVVSVDRFVFGESDSLSTQAHIRDISSTAPADLHLRHLCASCHLGNAKDALGPITEKSRGGGCNACHLNYPPEAVVELEVYEKRKDQRSLPQIHPALTIAVRNEHCFGCHSRSGRIATNFEGWHETQLLPEEVEGRTGFRPLDDGRVFEFIAPDVHYSAGLECIDCHHSAEIMGDGTTYFHEEEAVRVNCVDCHFSSPPATASFFELDQESKKIVGLRGFEHEDQRFLIGRSSGWAYTNVLVDSSGTAILLGKNTGARYPLGPPAAVCTRQGAHRDLTCSACHTAWAPQCIGCHNTFDPEESAFDLLEKKRTPGKWEEYLGEFFAEPPSLGIVEGNEEDTGRIREIKTFIPGMILTIDKSAFKDIPAGDQFIFHRLFAPAAPHTAAATGRNCRSCHNDPLALGYGRGKLDYQVAGNLGRWAFRPGYATSDQDGLPQDAWIPFLEDYDRASTTRPNARPFTVAEQQRILTVGACLTCHEEDSRVMLESLTNYDQVLKARTPQCVLPKW